jgi:uncharacterized membrane protein YbhN (UPF0104 family)
VSEHPTTDSDLATESNTRASKRNMIFAAPADDPRTRRPADVVILVVSLLIALLAAWAYKVDNDLDLRVLELFSDGLPGWLSAVCTAVFVVGGVYAVGLIVAIWLFGDGRGSVARDMVLAALLVLVLVTVASFIGGPEWPDVFPEFLERDGTPSFPVVRLAFVVAVLGVATPYLAVPMRQLGRRLILPMALSAIVLSYGSLSAVVGAYAVGAAAAAAVRLLVGSGVGIPSKARIASAFRAADVDAGSLAYLKEQPVGATLVSGRLVDGTNVLIKVYGRDAADAAAASRVWRSLWYRDVQRSLIASGLQQVEHEALMLLEGERAGVALPELIGWGRGEAGDAVIATSWFEADRLFELTADEIDDGILDGCWQAVTKLHDAGIAHRGIDGRRIVLLDSGVLIDGLSNAVISPDAATRSADIAQMIVTTALAVGSGRSIAAARRQIGDDAMLEGLQLLQLSALSPALQRDARRAKLNLKKLRSEVAETIGAPAPDVVQLQRVTWGNVAMVALTFFAASALISAMADIGLDTITDELSNAKWAWLVIALIVAQLTNVGEWISLTGMVGKPVPFAPTIMFRYAISFISLAVPSEAGAIAMNVRYMQRLGVPSAAALAQGPLLTIFSKGFDVVLLFITSRIIGQTVDLDDIDSGPVLRLVILVVVVVAAGAAITFSVPKLRRRVLPPLRKGLSSVRGSVTDPQRLLRIAGGTLMQRLLFAIALAAAVAAFGSSISFSEAIFVNSAVSLLVGLVPVPGGIGVAEAALTAGLIAVGVPEGPALAAAISHRVITSYLPPIYGWYTLRWLTDRDYL